MAYIYVMSRTPIMDSDTMEMAKSIIADKLPHYNMDNLYFDTQGDDKCIYPSAEALI